MKSKSSPSPALLSQKAFALTVLEWHGGQSCPLYAVGSCMLSDSHKGRVYAAENHRGHADTAEESGCLSMAILELKKRDPELAKGLESFRSPSAPLNLCAPVGVTGTTLADLPDRRTVWEMRVDGSFLRWCGTLEQFRKDCEEYCDRSKGHWEKVTNTEFRFISPEEPKITHFKAVKKGVDSVVESSATLPASPVKDTPADPLEGLNEDEIGLRHAQSWSKAGIPDLGAHLDAPASPVDSVGVPADPDDMNERRSEWTENAIREFMGESRTDRGDALSDLLSDFGHWADRNDTSLEAEIQRAAMHYNDETDGEGTQFSFLDASHAAKDAKIKALTEALADAIPTLEGDLKKTKEIAHLVPEIYADKAERISRLRAALALPCA